MPSYSENILSQILEIGIRDRVDVFDACVTYCEERDLETEEVFEYLDGNARAMLKQAALDTNKVRKCVDTADHALEFE